LKARVPVGAILLFERDLDEYVAGWNAQIMDFLKKKPAPRGTKFSPSR
jgi:hypothetical protein